jgi:hypothetical protein
MGRGLGSMVVLVLLLVWGAPSAGARGSRHCAFSLSPMARHGRVVEAELRPLGCFGSERAARDIAAEDSLVLIGREFNGSSYAGSSNDYFAPDTCQGNIYEVAYVGDAWNDKFQSGKGFGGCDHNKKFVASNFGGDSLTCTPNCTSYGSLSNEVSSLRWRP